MSERKEMLLSEIFAPWPAGAGPTRSQEVVERNPQIASAATTETNSPRSRDWGAPSYAGRPRDYHGTVPEQPWAGNLTTSGFNTVPCGKEDNHESSAGAASDEQSSGMLAPITSSLPATTPSRIAVARP